MKFKIIFSIAVFLEIITFLTGAPVELRYAKGFQVRQAGKIKIITIGNLRDPHEPPHSYVLIPDTMQEPPILPVGQIIRTPIKRAGSLSTTHLSHFVELGIRRRLKGFFNLSHILSPALQELTQAGLIKELGSNLEQMREVAMKEGIEIIFGFGPGDPQFRYEELNHAGIPVVFNREYMEPHPLGYAEWIKFTALFFHQEALAERIFSTMEKRYLALKKEASNCTFKPFVLMNSLYQGTWYLPGGNTYWANLIKDASGRYILRNNSSNDGGIPYTFEEVYKLGSNAHYWINADGFSCSELKDKDPRYARFGAFQKKNIFNRNKKESQGLPDDYYENGLSHPDILLRDLIAIFHPEFKNRDQLVWFRKAK